MSKKGIVYLVGSGPGDPKLFTLRGKECLEEADVVVYDRLCNPRLLQFARPDAELIYAGKRPDRHSLSQDEINQTLVDFALQGKTVVRLKGGDPFVFGRGGEEAEELVDAGVSFQIVPGITSAIAAPAYAGIPLTHRDFASSAAIITGHEDPDKDTSAHDWPKLATATGTLVFLMGVRNLPKIVDRLIENGRRADTPVACIRWGTWPRQQTVSGTLETIVEVVKREGLRSPAVIVVGGVAGLRPKLQWVENRPLFGKSILVTRSRAQSSRLATRLEDLGAAVIEMPTVEIEPVEDWTSTDDTIANLSSYSWLLFTSTNGVTYFLRRLLETGLDVRSLAGIRVAAVGKSTAQALEDRGILVDLVPAEFKAEAVLASLEGHVGEGDRCLLVRGNLNREVLAEGLKETGAAVDEVQVYRNVMPDTDKALLKELLSEGQIDIITFTSASTVRNLVAMLPEGDEQAALLAGVTTACIGPITAEAAVKQGLEVDVLAAEYTIDGLVTAIQKYST